MKGSLLLCNRNIFNHNSDNILKKNSYKILYTIDIGYVGIYLPPLFDGAGMWYKFSLMYGPCM